MTRFAKALVVAAVSAGFGVTHAHAEEFAAKCANLAGGFEASGRVIAAEFIPAGGVQMAPPAPKGALAPAPDHCRVEGKINERTGSDGKPYAIGYEIRLPAAWNGKIVFQGGGGVDGVLRPSLGVVGAAMSADPNALSVGYAVASTDAGHLEEPGPFGAYLFGLDNRARQDKGYSSVPPVTMAIKSAVAKVYGKPATRSYFAGCSNGGRQAMMVTQRYPDLFDGVLAAAPAYRVPLAAVDSMGQNRVHLALAPRLADGNLDFGSAYTEADLKLVSDAVLDACDGQDGVRDGMVQDLKACRFDPTVLTCRPGQNSACLSQDKVDGLKAMFGGTRNSKGETLYASWPYDPGIAAPGWRAWRLGTPGVFPHNARNLTLIPGSLAYDFFSPPEKITDVLAFVRGFDFDRDPPKLSKTVDGYEAGLEFETATSVELDAFKAKGGKMLFTHGGADPIFSALDTMAYIDRLAQKYADANDFARLFIVPGMNHCAGGPATDKFDALSALDTWVERNRAPDMILATARKAPDVPWPGRTRPLCPYPKVATYTGAGSVEDAANFVCK